MKTCIILHICIRLVFLCIFHMFFICKRTLLLRLEHQLIFLFCVTMLTIVISLLLLLFRGLDYERLEKMKKVIIVGATSGIGKKFAEMYAEDSCRVGITGHREKLLRELKENDSGAHLLQSVNKRL